MFHVKPESAQVEALIEQAAAVGVEVSEAEAHRHLRFLAWLLEQNSKLNLTAIKLPEQAITLHLVDSLAAAPEIKEMISGSILDLGTGGGLPGVPLAIHTSLPFTLLDATEKKAGALRSYVAVDNLEITVRSGRAEEYARECPAAYAGVVARAVTSLPSLVELASPLLVLGGRLVCLKGDPSDDEILRGERAAGLCGMRMIPVRTLALPKNAGARTIVTYEKTGEPQISIPRRVGKAQKQPLA